MLMPLYRNITIASPEARCVSFNNNSNIKILGSGPSPLLKRYKTARILLLVLIYGRHLFLSFSYSPLTPPLAITLEVKDALVSAAEAVNEL